MNDAQQIAKTYIAFWNAADAVERGRLYEAGFRPDATYADPHMRGAGPQEIGALAAGAQQRFPGFAFRLIGPADGHGEFVRFRWALGPAGAEAPIEGSDVVRLSGGRIAEVIGFLDKLPQ
ncbi:MAG TPA: nuclear transport factor 2 family protein [Roseiarcus sp.]|nr:nuclear transport factor 2 family protein [Roseiarcus sp.]